MYIDRMEVNMIIGVRRRNKTMGQVENTCKKCQKSTAQTVVRTHLWFSLFFISLFPYAKISSARCAICGTQIRVKNQQVDAWFPKQPPAAVNS